MQRRIDISSGDVSTMAGALYADGPATASTFPSLAGIAMDAASGVAVLVSLHRVVPASQRSCYNMLRRHYQTDAFRHVVRRIDMSTGSVSTVAGAASIQGHANGRGSSAVFDTPQGVAVGAMGALIVSSRRCDFY